mmetsp:Transcript_92792/g.251740  ORF Transcript_92792/g.251740 Transcript_92792/m.251740 type:complete len:342 (+) Transcript_92792:300-1325(+)
MTPVMSWSPELGGPSTAPPTASTSSAQQSATVGPCECSPSVPSSWALQWPQPRSTPPTIAPTLRASRGAWAASSRRQNGPCSMPPAPPSGSLAEPCSMRGALGGALPWRGARQLRWGRQQQARDVARPRAAQPQARGAQQRVAAHGAQDGAELLGLVARLTREREDPPHGLVQLWRPGDGRVQALQHLPQGVAVHRQGPVVARLGGLPLRPVAELARHAGGETDHLAVVLPANLLYQRALRPVGGLGEQVTHVDPVRAHRLCRRHELLDRGVGGPAQLVHLGRRLVREYGLQDGCNCPSGDQLPIPRRAPFGGRVERVVALLAVLEQRSQPAKELLLVLHD